MRSAARRTVIKLRWGKTAQELLFEGAKPGIKFALGENPKRQGYPTQNVCCQGPAPERRYPGTRMGVEEVIRQGFPEAKNYQADWKAYNEGVATRGTLDPSAERPEA